MGIENFNIKIGEFPSGKNNLITDVEGIKVGHTTLDEGKIKTGVTALIPHGGNIFREKAYVLFLCNKRLWKKAAAWYRLMNLEPWKLPLFSLIL